MATQIWAASDGVWDTGANWSGASKPGANDTVIFPANSTQAVTSGHTDENGVDVDLLWIQEGYNAAIGGSGSELYMSADKIIHEGGGALWFKAGDTVTDEVIINAQSSSSGMTNATLNGTGTTDYTAITILRGKVALGATLSTLTTLTIGSRTNAATDASVTMAAGSTATTVWQYGGTFANDSAITTLNLINGIINQDTATITTVNMFGGTLNFLFGGTITTVNQYGGLFDPTRSGVAKTITTLNIYGGEYRRNALTTYTTVNDYRKTA